MKRGITQNKLTTKKENKYSNKIIKFINEIK